MHQAKLGFTVVEAVVGAAIIAGAVLVMLNIFGRLIQIANHNLRVTQSSFLAEEGAEALRFLRDGGWGNLSSLTPGADHYLNFDGANWQASASNVFVDGLFERKFTLARVYRDGATRDINPAGVLDPDTLFFTVSVAWRDTAGATTTRNLNGYLTNLFNQ